MHDIIEFPIEGGGAILVEAAHQSATAVTRRGNSGTTPERARVTFAQALEHVQPMASHIRDMLQSLEMEEATVEFGLVLNAEVGALLVSGSTTAHYKITICWKQPAAVKPTAAAWFTPTYLS